MKPNKMKRHFDAKHPNFAGKDVQYFKNKADGVKKAGLILAARKQHTAAGVRTVYLCIQNRHSSQPTNML